MEIKTGVFTDIIFHNEENGYTIAEMETDEELLTVVGNLSKAVRGTCYELTGEFKIHPRYGEQFVFSSAAEKLPTTVSGIEVFLASGVIKGIGPKTATSIVNCFGEKSLDIMENDPDRLCQISGIGPKTADKIAKSFAEHKEFAKVSMAFQEMGVTSSQALRLYKAYGRNAISIISENPYRLVDELYGFGFRKADQVAEKMGVAGDSPFRIQSGIKYGLTAYVNDGSTYVPRDILCEKVAEMLELTREQIADGIFDLIISGDIQMDEIDGEKVTYLFSFYNGEQTVCRNLNSLAKAELKTLTVDIDKCIEMTENTTEVYLSESQKSAVKKSVQSGVSVITGGPGTGKTTIINTIINIFEENDFKVAIAAPTGRAAKRITETSGHYASTIHRLLEYFYSEDTGDMQFGKTREDPLEYDVVIVDEASMVDLILMKGLTDAVKPGTRLILVGDSDQLPSVGAGNVLRDLILSGFVTTSKLTEIYRQAQESMIVTNAHRINHGEYPTLNSKDGDFFHMERNNEIQMRELIVDLVKERLPDYYGGIDGVRDIQVLSPTKKGNVGTIELNRVLQETFNPHREGISEKKFMDRVFRVGDKVMQIKNNYQMEWKILSRGEAGQGVFNGDVGFIAYIDAENQNLTVIYDDEKYVEYDFSQLDELELAYAVTVHKSQGSEFPIMVMPISWFPPMLATRNLLYTAVTRGKKVVVLVGSENRLRAMVDNDRIKLRYSGLTYRLSNLMTFD